MKIKEYVWQNRRDFRAVFVCESCGAEQSRTGYDDHYFHNEVIPDMVCPQCGEKAPQDYQPIKPKYEPWEVV